MQDVQIKDQIRISDIELVVGTIYAQECQTKWAKIDPLDGSHFAYIFFFFLFFSLQLTFHFSESVETPMVIAIIL